MGTFEGHVIPSIIYSLVALWWGFVHAVKYIRTLKNEKLTYKNATIMPCFFCPTKRLRVLPIESFIKLTFLSIHGAIEIITGVHRSNIDGHLMLENENAHHVCMISGFIVGALVEILIFYGVPFPKKTEYMFNLLAFFIQILIMTGHLKGDDGIEFNVHMLWTVIIFFSFFVGCLEVYKPTNFWIIYMRIFFLLAQGTWLMQIAFVVWPHTTNPMFIWKMDHTSHTWLMISLMYHFIGCAVLLMCQYLFVYFAISIFDKCYQNYELDMEEFNALRSKRYDRSDETNNKEYSFLINEEDDV